MILIKCTNETKPSDLILVAQNSVTYDILGFSETGTPYDYDTDHIEFDNYGRYKHRSGVMPATELELRSEFFTQYVARKTSEAKTVRDNGRFLPLTVTINTIDHTFDMDSTAQSNIAATLVSFEAARLSAVSLGWPDDGTLPWTLADNSILPLTSSDLQLVHDTAVTRGYELHATYQSTKASLEALLP